MSADWLVTHHMTKIRVCQTRMTIKVCLLLLHGRQEFCNEYLEQYHLDKFSEVYFPYSCSRYPVFLPGKTYEHKV